MARGSKENSFKRLINRKGKNKIKQRKREMAQLQEPVIRNGRQQVLKLTRVHSAARTGNDDESRQSGYRCLYEYWYHGLINQHLMQLTNLV